MKMFKVGNSYINTEHIASIDGNCVYMVGNEYTRFKYELTDEELNELLVEIYWKN